MDQIDAEKEFNERFKRETDKCKQLMKDLGNKIDECNNFDLEIKSIQY